MSEQEKLDAEFQQLLSDSQDAFSKAASRWVPPDSEYDVIVTDVNMMAVDVTDDQDNVIGKALLIKPKYQIVNHPEYQDVEFFDPGMSTREKILGILKTYLESALDAQFTGILNNDVQLLKSLSQQLHLRIKVVTNKSGYPNIRVVKHHGILLPPGEAVKTEAPPEPAEMPK
jgi:hypothetical protein